MKDSYERPVCNTCGAPRTQVAQDTYTFFPEEGFASTEFRGEPKIGCDEHGVGSERLMRGPGLNGLFDENECEICQRRPTHALKYLAVEVMFDGSEASASMPFANLRYRCDEHPFENEGGEV